MCFLCLVSLKRKGWSQRGTGEDRQLHLVSDSITLVPSVVSLGAFTKQDKHIGQHGAVHLSSHDSATTPPWSSLHGCSALRQGEGVWTVGRLHPGQAGERLLKQHPKAPLWSKSLQPGWHDEKVIDVREETICLLCSNTDMSPMQCGHPEASC